MKLQWVIPCLLLPVTLSAQWIVEDPVAIAQDAVNQTVNLAKYVEMVNNQVNQLNTMTQELEQVTAYTKAFGNPESLLSITGADQVTGSLHQFEGAQSFTSLQQQASGVNALLNTGNGLYSSIAPIGIEGAERDRERYKPYGALEGTVSHYETTHQRVSTEAADARRNLASSTEALQAASTDAEVQKLKGVIAAQQAHLNALQGEVATAASHVAVQEAQNRNNAEKQDEAQMEADAIRWKESNKALDSKLTLPGRKQ